MKSHLVSQTLLRRFSKKNQVIVTNKFTGLSLLSAPKQLGWTEIPEKLILKSEKQWSYVETRTATAFHALDNGDVLKSTKHVETLKKFMTLHFVRSHALLILFTKNEAEYFEQFIDEAKKNHPEKADEIEANIDLLRRNWRTSLVKMLPDLFKSNIKKIEDYISSHNLEIGIASDSANFILGDNPIVNIGEDGRLGVLSGVGIKSSIGFILPLGPKHIVALSTKTTSTEYRKLSNNEVNNSNQKILMSSLREYYTLPL